MPDGFTIVQIPDVDMEALERAAPSYCRNALARVLWAIATACPDTSDVPAPPENRTRDA
jgi:hypothetical protein